MQSRLPRQLSHWFLYFSGQLKKYLFSKRGFFLTLIGPDGAGKSTIANLLLLNTEIDKLFQDKKYFHGHFSYLPELKKIFFFLNIRQQKTKEQSFNQLGILRAIIYPLYYGFNYLFGWGLILRKKINAGLVIFDRYFYDYLIQKQFVRCPRWLLYAIAKVIPQPDAIIYLKNPPHAIYARKPELEIKEIGRQSDMCEAVVNHFDKRSFIVENSGMPQETILKIQHIIINIIKKRNKH
jgi:thymidylate kinase